MPDSPLPESIHPPPVPLIEGVHYYIERGKWVFTATYHLRRGTCCDSGCRHCPYDPPAVEDRPATADVEES
jgi:hypothetical protein